MEPEPGSGKVSCGRSSKRWLTSLNMTEELGALDAGVRAPFPQRLDEVSRQWVRDLVSVGPERDRAIVELHQLLLRAAMAEALRRSGTNGVAGKELEDLAHQAADDAVVLILRKVTEFRGESRFTTWAYRFAIFEVSTKIGRHVWRRDGVLFDQDAWERLPERLGQSPESVAASRELLKTLREGIDTVLTPHQRRVFAAIVVDGSPLDALVVEMDTNRNAIYKTVFDARKKLHAFLVARGQIDP